MWKISYFKNGEWITLEEGQGGWIDNETGNNFDLSSSIYEWGGPDQTPIIAEALRIQLFSDGIHDLISIHLRGRGGISENINDSLSTPKASLIQYLPANTLNLDKEPFELLNIIVDNYAETINIYGQSNDEIKFILHDLNGRFIKNGKLVPNNIDNTIDVSNLSSGIYILLLKNNNGKSKIQKLIIN